MSKKYIKIVLDDGEILSWEDEEELSIEYVDRTIPYWVISYKSVYHGLVGETIAASIVRTIMTLER